MNGSNSLKKIKLKSGNKGYPLFLWIICGAVKENKLYDVLCGQLIYISVNQRIKVKKLLIIEDDTDARDMMVFMFENNGFEVISARKEITDEEITQLGPNIIVVDHLLGGDTPGNEVCVKLKASKLVGHIPIILYSANLDIDKINHNSCADAFVAKPFELEDFRWLVSRLAL